METTEMESTAKNSSEATKARKAAEARERAKPYRKKFMVNRKRKLDDMDIRANVESAIKRGDFAFVFNCVSRWDRDKLNLLDYGKRTILHKATLELARYSQNQWGLASNSDPSDCTSHQDDCPLNREYCNADVEMCDADKADYALNKQDYDTKLHDRIRIVLWLANLVDGTIKDVSGYLAVRAVLKSRNRMLQHVVDVLLAKEGVLELCCQDGDILLDAVYWGRWEIVRSVIAKQDKVTQRQSKVMVLRTFFYDNCLSYHACVAPDDMSFLDDVINEPNNVEYTPLLRAIHEERSELVIKLVKNGANIAPVVNLRKNNRLSYLVVEDPETNKGTLSAIIHALKAPAKLGSRHCPCEMNRIELTSEAYHALIRPSIVHITDQNGNTPLHLATESGKTEVMEKLIEAGADLIKKNKNDEIPLQLGITCWDLLQNKPSILHNPEAIFQLIPKNDVIDFHAVIEYVDALNESAEIYSRESIPEVLSRLLLCTKREDFFRLCRVKAVQSLNGGELVYALTRRNTNDEEVPWLSIKLSDMYVISYLVRKGLNGTTSPGCSAALKKYRAQGGLYGPNDGQMDARFEKAAKEAEEVDSLFEGPLSAFELSSFAIRDSIHQSKYETISQLPKPKLIINHLLFLELGSKICELL